jgi:hypothetical protein
VRVQLADIDDRSNTPIFSYCRKLVKQGLDPKKTSLEVYRGDILAMTIKEIGVGAQLTVHDNSSGRPVFTKWKPFRMPQKGVS